ncbi:sigma-70 family RNA polymerase sigma factor [Roseateles sp. So40a]|uniref:sigma-70 family RNA polymerase sigma factor n=1 Tax=Roseateles sp. So40a TaxID=3400226 RepID=UPI003A855279
MTASQPPSMQPPSAHPLIADFIAHRPLLKRAAWRWMGDRDLADDVVQEAYMKLMQAAPPGGVQQPVAYCMRVVQHLCIDHLRRRQTEQQLLGAEDEGLDQESSTGTPEHQAIGRQLLQCVDRCLRGLPARTRQAFVLHRVHGHTQQEVAQRLGVSITLVNFMVQDAAQALARCPDLRAKT